MKTWVCWSHSWIRSLFCFFLMVVLAPFMNPIFVCIAPPKKPGCVGPFHESDLCLCCLKNWLCWYVLVPFMNPVIACFAKIKLIAGSKCCLPKMLSTKTSKKTPKSSRNSPQRLKTSKNAKKVWKTSKNVRNFSRSRRHWALCRHRSRSAERFGRKMSRQH